MIVFDMTAKVLGTGNFSQLTIAYLISGITLIVLLSQEKPLPLKEINAQIQTDTKIHTQTEIPKVSGNKAYKYKKLCPIISSFFCP